MSSQPHRATSAVRWRRSALGALAGLAGAAAIVGPTALASGNASSPTKTAPTGSTSTNDCGGPAPAAVIAAIAQLEQNGTIDQAQEQAIDAGLNGCFFDLQQLVNNGTITAAQAQAVENALRQVKVSLAAAQRNDMRHARRQAHRPAHHK